MKTIILAVAIIGLSGTLPAYAHHHSGNPPTESAQDARKDADKAQDRQDRIRAFVVDHEHH